MNEHVSAAPVFAAPASGRATRRTPWHERLMLRLYGLPTDEQIEERMRDYKGFIARLTPEQIAAMDAYDGPEVLGPANGPRRTF